MRSIVLYGVTHAATVFTELGSFLTLTIEYFTNQLERVSLQIQSDLRGRQDDHRCIKAAGIPALELEMLGIVIFGSN